MKRNLIILAMIIITVFLAMSNLYRYGWITPDSLKNSKDWIGAAKDVITIVVIMLGAIFSYYKYFGSRTFDVNAEIEITTQVVEVPGGQHLLFAVISLINKGNLTIWNPVCSVRAIAKNNAEDQVEEVTNQQLISSYFNDQQKRILLINAGEKGDYVIPRTFEAAVWSVIYEVEITDEAQNRWTKSTIVSTKTQKPS